MNIPSNATESARCESWDEAAKAGQFLYDFLTTNANRHPREWVHWAEDPVTHQRFWYVHTLVPAVDPVVIRR